MNACILLLLVAIGLIGCAEFKVPILRADKIDCEYHREHSDATWSCQLEGTGQLKDVF